jgi:hypothetical protein
MVCTASEASNVISAWLIDLSFQPINHDQTRSEKLSGVNRDLAISDAREKPMKSLTLDKNVAAFCDNYQSSLRSVLHSNNDLVL